MSGWDRLPEPQLDDMWNALGDNIHVRLGLAGLSDTCPWATLQILPFLPFRNQVLPRCPGPMQILRFTEAPGPGMMHLRGALGGVCLIDQPAITGHLRAFTHLQLSALPPDRSAQLLREMAGEEA